jgi:preprotein translocase subunit SecY
MDGRQVPKVSWSTRKLPIKLFYALNMPIILQTALVLLSRISCTVRLLGTWEEVEASAGRMIPGWRHCLLHFTTVDTFKEIIYDPLHAVFCFGIGLVQ